MKLSKGKVRLYARRQLKLLRWAVKAENCKKAASAKSKRKALYS